MRGRGQEARRPHRRSSAARHAAERARRRERGGGGGTLPAVIPEVMEKASTDPQALRAGGGSSAGACMHTRLARCPLVSPTTSVKSSGHASALQNRTRDSLAHRRQSRLGLLQAYSARRLCIAHALQTACTSSAAGAFAACAWRVCLTTLLSHEAGFSQQGGLKIAPRRTGRLQVSRGTWHDAARLHEVTGSGTAPGSPHHCYQIVHVPEPVQADVARRRWTQRRTDRCEPAFPNASSATQMREKKR